MPGGEQRDEGVEADLRACSSKTTMLIQAACTSCSLHTRRTWARSSSVHGRTPRDTSTASVTTLSQTLPKSRRDPVPSQLTVSNRGG